MGSYYREKSAWPEREETDPCVLMVYMAVDEPSRLLRSARFALAGTGPWPCSSCVDSWELPRQAQYAVANAQVLF